MKSVLNTILGKDKTQSVIENIAKEAENEAVLKNTNTTSNIVVNHNFSNVQNINQNIHSGTGTSSSNRNPISSSESYVNPILLDPQIKEITNDKNVLTFKKEKSKLKKLLTNLEIQLNSTDKDFLPYDNLEKNRSSLEKNKSVFMNNSPNKFILKTNNLQNKSKFKTNEIKTNSNIANNSIINNVTQEQDLLDISEKENIDTTKYKALETETVTPVPRVLRKSVIIDNRGPLKLYKNVYDSMDDGLGDNNIEQLIMDHNESDTWVFDMKSTFRGCWSFLIFILIIYSTTVTPYKIAFSNDDDNISINYLDLIVDLIFMVDVILNFFTPYYNNENNLVGNHKMIVINYLSTWFLFDLISSFPTDVFKLIYEAEDTNSGY